MSFKTPCWRSSLWLFFSFILFNTSYLQAQNIIARIDTSYANIKYVEIKAGFCKVELGAISENGRVEFFGEISTKQDVINHGRRYPYKFRHTVWGNTLKVWLEGGNRRHSLKESRLMFKVPPKTNVSIVNREGNIYAFGLQGDFAHLETRSGKIDAQYIAARAVEFKTFRGRIKVENLNTSKAKFQSHSGSIKLTDATSTTVIGRSHNGSQRWINLKGDLDASGHNASIRVIGGKGKVSLKSYSGSLRVYDYIGLVKVVNYNGYARLKNVHGELNLKTTRGNIIGEGILFMKNSTLQSSFGYIKMKLKNDLKKIDYDLKSGGDVRIGEDKYGKRLRLNNGNNILVKAISNKGNLFFEKYEEER